MANATPEYQHPFEIFSTLVCKAPWRNSARFDVHMEYRGDNGFRVHFTADLTFSQVEGLDTLEIAATHRTLWMGAPGERRPPSIKERLMVKAMLTPNGQHGLWAARDNGVAFVALTWPRLAKEVKQETRARLGYSSYFMCPALMRAAVTGRKERAFIQHLAVTPLKDLAA